MNFSYPIDKYTKDDISSKVENDDPHRIIEEILNELKKNLALLSYCLEHKNSLSDVKSKSFSKSLTALYILQQSLDFSKGGEIANNLFELYEFCRTTVLKSFSSQDHNAIKNLIPIIEEILDGWCQIKK